MISTPLTTSNKKYISVLAIAIALLLFTTTVAYKQIIKLQGSAEMVSHTLEVQDAINMLFSHYFRLESEEFKSEILKDSLTNSIYADYKKNGKEAFEKLSGLIKDNASQKLRLDQIKGLQDSLYKKLANQKIVSKSQLEEDLSELLVKIRAVNDEMRTEERSLLLLREDNYESNKILAPFTTLILAIFSLCIFLLAFLRIYRNKIKLRESEAFLQSVLANTNNVVNFYVPIFNAENKVYDFEIKFANAQNKEFFGLNPNDIIGKRITEIYPFLKLNGEVEGLFEAYNQSKSVSFDRQIQLHKEKMWIRSTVHPLLNGLLVTAQNVTDEEKYKEEQLSLKEQVLADNKKLKETENFLNRVLSSTENIISYFTPIFDEHKRITDFGLSFYNDKIVDVVQLEMSFLQKQRMSVVFPMIFENGVFDHLVSCFEENRIVRFEAPYEFNQRLFWFKSTAVKLDNGILITSIDTTSERNTEEHLQTLNLTLEQQNRELASSRGFLTNVFKSISNIVIHFTSIRNHEGDIIDLELQFINSRVTDFLGINPDAIKHKKASEVFPSIFDGGIFKKLKKSIENNTNIEYETPFDKNGKTHWFKATAIKLGDGVTVSIQDVTDEKNQKEQLRLRNLELKKSNIELEAFNRVASHDLQEPLRKIQLFISRILENKDQQLSDKNVEYFNKIENAASRMRSLIINLLNYSHIDGKHQDFEPVDLNETLKRAKEDLSSIISETSSEIHHENLPTIKGVPYQLEQLFTNLISNGIKYNTREKTPRINITYEKVALKDIDEQFFKVDQYYYKLCFVDNGIGFSMKHSTKIFEVFQRLHQKSDYSGTGIGLAICKKIIENHHGHIHVTSEPNRGSTFICYLPAS
ncbi:ATP-binding protein [Maribacter sp. X9]|uniref:ATP-binding protein n=1 Tax=Maribacter sp. X9 TaxID=3402159 RepID=UPI003AF3B470